MLVKRNILDLLDDFIKQKEYLAIRGPRQAGKTTLLNLLEERLIKNFGVSPEAIQKINFEDRTLLSQFEENPIAFVNFYRQGKPVPFYLMLDEYQYVGDGGQKLKLIYDQLGQELKIIITGSSSLELKALIGKYLVGRILTFELYPFDFYEFLLSQKEDRLADLHDKIKNKIKLVLQNKKVKFEKEAIFAPQFLEKFEEYLIFGGYPSVCLAATRKAKVKILHDILNNYLLKDIKGLLALATENSLLRLSQFLAAQLGNLVVYKELSQASGLGYRQVLHRLGILLNTYIITELRPFYKNFRKELVKTPKIYFVDPGFRNLSINNFNVLNLRSDQGALVENFACLRLKELLWPQQRINFWRTKAGAEVDFVTQSAGEVIPWEVKYSSFKKAKVTRGLRSFIEVFKPKKAFVLNKDFLSQSSFEGCKIYFIPIYFL